jgi:hypothetical protein
MKSRKINFILLALFLSSSLSTAQQRIALSDTTKYYDITVNYWFNMHHFLWLEAFMNTEMDSTLITQSLSSENLAQLNIALTYYKEGLVEEDLRMSDYQTSFKEWITSDKAQMDDIPAEFQDHMEVLMSFNETYEKLFWPEHFKACKEVLIENLPLIESTEEAYVDKITKLTRQFWDFEKIKVDLTYYAKSSDWNPRNRPYTSIFPTHVVMNAVGENDVKGNWVELLYHESAHHLILSSNYFIGGTIKDVVEAKNLKSPRQLWHAILFYLTGEISKDLLEKEKIPYPETYMQRNNVFGSSHALLEKHFRPYIDRKVTLAQAVEDFILDSQKKE